MVEIIQKMTSQAEYNSRETLSEAKITSSTNARQASDFVDMFPGKIVDLLREISQSQQISDRACSEASAQWSKVMMTSAKNAGKHGVEAAINNRTGSLAASTIGLCLSIGAGGALANKNGKVIKSYSENKQKASEILNVVQTLKADSRMAPEVRDVVNMNIGAHEHQANKCLDTHEILKKNAETTHFSAQAVNQIGATTGAYSNSVFGVDAAQENALTTTANSEQSVQHDLSENSSETRRKRINDSETMKESLTALMNINNTTNSTIAGNLRA